MKPSIVNRINYKPLLRRTARFACHRLVAISPKTFIDCLRHEYPELVALEFNSPDLFKWNEVRLPDRPETFEDLLPLFWLSPLNRGIIRQDLDEAAALFRVVRSLRPCRGVEIGRYMGGSTVLLATAVGPEGKLVSIDVYPSNDLMILEALRRTNLRDRVELIVSDANELDRKEAQDFVFIDGDHTYEGVKRDHNKWGRLTRVGGYIIHHDMAKQRCLTVCAEGVARLRADILTRQGSELELIEEASSLSIFRRKSASWTEI